MRWVRVAGVGAEHHRDTDRNQSSNQVTAQFFFSFFSFFFFFFFLSPFVSQSIIGSQEAMSGRIMKPQLFEVREGTSAVGLGQLEVVCCWDGSESPEWELSTIETQTGIKVQPQHILFLFFFSFFFFFGQQQQNQHIVTAPTKSGPSQLELGINFFLNIIIYRESGISNQVWNQVTVSAPRKQGSGGFTRLPSQVFTAPWSHSTRFELAHRISPVCVYICIY